MRHVNPRDLAGSSALATPRIVRGVRTHDALQTFDQATVDSLGSFFVQQLERLDMKLHDPLVAVTWGRDIDIRTDVSVGDDLSSYTVSTFAAAGGVNPNGKNWISSDANAISGITADIGKTANALNLWGMELKYTLPELERSMVLGQPIDATKYKGLQLKYQMDIDEQVYIGDTTLGVYGLCNGDSNTGQMQVTQVSNVANITGNIAWTTKTPVQILADVNTLLNAVWQNSGWAVIPTELRLPPAQYSYLISQLISTAGNQSIMRFLLENNLAAQNGQKLNIQPLKWLIGQGVGGTPGTLGTVDRMMAYTKDADRVRFPMTPLLRTPLEYRSIYQSTTYWGKLGVVEFVYPETVGYMDQL